MKKAIIETVQHDRKEGTGVRRWDDGRGECVQLSHDEEVAHVALLEIIKGKVRGRHYHKLAEEVFYIMKGEVRLTITDQETRETETHIVKAGDRIRIKPLCIHSFEALEDTWVIEYSLAKYAPGDIYVD